jgi:hypothetical protein
MLLARAGQSSERSSRRFSYLQFDDPVHSKLVDGTLWRFRPEQDQAAGDDSQWRWKRVEFNETGAINQRGLYLYAPLESDKQRVVILDSGSHGEMYVNGEPRAANVYGRNYFHAPVLLNKGTSHLILRAGRREFKIRYHDPPARQSTRGARSL